MNRTRQRATDWYFTLLIERPGRAALLYAVVAGNAVVLLGLAGWLR